MKKKSHRSYSRKERSEFVNVEIDVGDWSDADDEQRLSLIMVALKEAVRSTRTDRLSDDAKHEIVERLESALIATCS